MSIKKYEEKSARQAAKKRAERMQMQEIGAGAIIGAAEGLAKKQGVTFVSDGFGPLKFSWIQAGVGYYLAKKKTGKMREFGSALAVIGAYKATHELAENFDLSALSLG